ncbi:AbrB family transcriptional regulator [Pseudothauera nasutitermitis]|uniref:AbrB family transcriptional regulator n=1 Tax=Pseudothauera nasutitermitis TaxID=2565930 RepID=A0A4S4AWT3_9RHOO|nr:AbrB family transcriptional regulator [Pseudothauera nasutitermitis]THF64512.1 AbrB family transcriptional regulator [Pseudothauera nasutitermitis]
MKNAWRCLLGLCVALFGAALALWLDVPLPWLLGPLILTAATRLSGVASRCPSPVNRLGRWVIGVSLGLYFTPQVAASVAQHWALIVLGMTYALLLACIGSWAYRRYAGLDVSTAWFAAAIGSASEMANMAARHGARVDQVASAHSMRVLLVVVVVPFAFRWFGDHGGDVLPDVRELRWPGLAWLVLGAWASGWLFQKLRLPNAWMLGPMAFAMLVTLFDLRLSALPQWVSWAGQLCIGWSLGDKYRPDFLRSAPRLLAVATVSSLLFMGASALLGWGVAHLVELPAPTLILALVPGGIAEMTITAKVLGLGVPIVTAMQVMRMLFVVLGTGPIYRRWVARAG